LLHDFLGGDALASVMAAVSFDLPIDALRAAGLRGHVRLLVELTMMLTLKQSFRLIHWSCNII
jgi:hypothetical protein